MKAKKEPVMTTIPSSVSFGLIQLPQDYSPAPPARRLLQVVISNNTVHTYISESAYADFEVHALFDTVKASSFAQGIVGGRSKTLVPFKGTIHWKRFIEGENLKLSPRVNPETGEQYE